jgi:hypothetical protein
MIVILTTKSFITGREGGKKSLVPYHHADLEESYVFCRRVAGSKFFQNVGSFL